LDLEAIGSFGSGHLSEMTCAVHYMLLFIKH